MLFYVGFLCNQVPQDCSEFLEKQIRAFSTWHKLLTYPVLLIIMCRWYVFPKNPFTNPTEKEIKIILATRKTCDDTTISKLQVSQW